MKKIYCAVLLLGSLQFPAVMAFADAGSVLREYKDTTIMAPGKRLPEKIQYQEPLSGIAEEENQSSEPVAQGVEVLIDKINVVGNTTLSPETLHEVLAPYTGHPLTTAEIHEAANALMQAIRAGGAFVAKVYILPQHIIDNTVTFNVIEGHLAENGIIIDPSSGRVNDAIILSQLEHALQPGSVITSDKYERAIYLTNDLPGIKRTQNRLLPADKVGEARFKDIPEDDELLTGTFYYDNFGSKYTGRNRWGALLQLNSPTGHAEKVTAGANISDLGTFFGFMDVNLWLYPNGLRGGVTADYLDYATDEPNDLRGSALDGSLYLQYPILRSRLRNLFAELYYTYSALEDEYDLGKITDRKLHVGSLRLLGDKSDSLLGGGVTTARIEGYVGSVNLDDYEPFKEYDAEHADTQGGFSRATFSLTRLQNLIGNLQGYVAVHGQVASKHMDPSQSISFGGPYEFPGYHTGEIFGDEGWATHVDLRYNIPYPPWAGKLQLSVYYDYGWLNTHTVAVVDGYSVPGAVESSFHLQTVGCGLSQIWDHFTLQGILGWQVDNEIPDSLLDDNGSSSFQGWVHLAYTF